MNHLIYFNQSESCNVDKAVEQLSNLVDKFDICQSWAELLTSLTSTESELKLVLIHKSLLEIPNITVNEVIDSMLTVTALVKVAPTVLSAVMIDEPCLPAFIQTLKKSNIVGIVPCADQFGTTDFIGSVTKLLEGKQVWDEKYVLPKIKKATVRHATDYGIRLTSRQQDIMQLIANRGLSNKKIAQVLNISESTVKVHISAILKAYGVRNRTQLALAGSKGLHA